MSSRRTWWGAAAGLTLGLMCAGGTGLAQEEGTAARRPWSATKPKPQGVLGKLLAPKEEEPELKVTKGAPANAPGERAAPRPANQIPRMTSKGDVVAQLAKERETFLRRLEVCDRLRTVAEETGNESLKKEADQIEERARQLYQQRTAKLLSTDMELTSPSKAEAKLLEEPTPRLPRNDTAQIRTIRGSGPQSSSERKE